MNQFSKILFKVSRAAYYLAILLVPIFFLPFTAEALEYNKQYLLYALVLVSVLTWIGAAVSERRFEFRRTPLDLPLLAFWVILLASSLASKDRHLSFLGNFENLNFGFASLSFYILLYFLTTNIVTSVARARLVFGAVILSGLLAIAYFFLQYFGLIAKMGLVLKVGNPVANLTTSFGFYALSLVIIALNALFLSRKQKLYDILWCLLFAISLAAIAGIGFKLIWVVLAVGLFFLLVFAISRLEDLRTIWISVGFSVFVIALLFTLLGTPSFLAMKLPVEVSLSNSVTWKIVTQVLGDNVLRFVLGSGPSTFAYSFSEFRPEALNNTFVWNLRFSQGSSSFLETLGATGFLGAAAFLLTILLALGTVLYLWTRKPVRSVRKAETAAGEGEGAILSSATTIWLVLLLIFFIGSLTTVLWMQFIVMLGVMMSFSKAILAPEAKPWTVSLKTSPQYSLASSFGFILVFSAVIVLGAFLGRFYAANINYARALRAISGNNYEKAITASSRAVNLHPSNVSYNLVLSQSYLLQAAAESIKQPPNVGLITNLLAYAVNGARRATTLAPSSVAAWESLAIMYSNARGVAPDANDWVIRSLNKAIELEKTNPTHYLRRGGSKMLSQDKDGAKKDYEEAIRLKADYVDAYVALAFLEESMGDADGALVHMLDAARFAGRNFDVLYQVGRLAYNRNKDGDAQLAEQAFLAVIQQNPNHANSLYSLGLLYERQDKTKEALELYRRVQKLNPQNAEVRKKIENLTPSSSEGAE